MTSPFAGLDLDTLSIGENKRSRVGPVARKSSTNFQEKRRKEALLRQQQARQDRADQARQIALATEGHHADDRQVGLCYQQACKGLGTQSQRLSAQLNGKAEQYWMDAQASLHVALTNTSEML